VDSSTARTTWSGARWSLPSTCHRRSSRGWQDVRQPSGSVPSSDSGSVRSPGHTGRPPGLYGTTRTAGSSASGQLTTARKRRSWSPPPPEAVGRPRHHGDRGRRADGRCRWRDRRGGEGAADLRAAQRPGRASGRCRSTASSPTSLPPTSTRSGGRTRRRLSSSPMEGSAGQRLAGPALAAGDSNGRARAAPAPRPPAHGHLPMGSRRSQPEADRHLGGPHLGGGRPRPVWAPLPRPRGRRSRPARRVRPQCAGDLRAGALRPSTASRMSHFAEEVLQ
jgi:hypothetical protein